MNITTNDFKDVFPQLLDKDLINEILALGVYKSLKQNDVLIARGEYIRSVPLVISGTLKVYRVSDEGKEIFLYYLTAGDTCADSIQCCFTNRKSQVKAIAEEDSEVIMVSISDINRWTATYKSWKEFIMLSFKEKFSQLLETLDAIAFQKMDERLLLYLQEKQKVWGKTEMQLTHQEIATDLNTSREVISRLLKTLENEEKVVLGRNRITLLY